MGKIFRTVFIAVAALALGFGAMLIATALLDKIIWPSLMAGIPFGIIVFVISFIALKFLTHRS